MNLGITGIKGMLGTDLADLCRTRGIGFSGYDLPGLDITKPLAGSNSLKKCDLLINCAAYTDVDGAESESEKAFAVNGDGAGRLAEWCRLTGTKLIHISTDYVFDGLQDRPYREGDAVNPVNVYGMSKLAGEQEVIQKLPDAVIVRTQSLFGVHGRNFVKAISGRLADGSPVRVVQDQMVCPTYTRHLSEAVLKLAGIQHSGVVHICAAGSCSWYEFAVEIAKRIRPAAEVTAIQSGELKRPAKRPVNSVFDCARYRQWTGAEMPGWKKGLEEYLEEAQCDRIS